MADLKLVVLLLAACGAVSSADSAANPKSSTSYTYKNKAYYMETFFKASYYKAFMYCSKMGMNLLSIGSEDEFNKLSEYIKTKLKHENEMMFWTSGAALDPKEFHWMYTGGAVGLASKWLAGEPNNLSGEEDCLQLWMKEPGFMVLNDQSCRTRSYFICQTANWMTS